MKTLPPLNPEEAKMVRKLLKITKECEDHCLWPTQCKLKKDCLVRDIALAEQRYSNGNL